MPDDATPASVMVDAEDLPESVRDELGIEDSEEPDQESSPDDVDDQPVPEGILEFQTHQMHARLMFADEHDGLSPFWAINAQWDQLLGCDDTIEAADTTWRIDHDAEGGEDADGKTTKWTSGIAAREQDNFDVFEEYQVGLVADDDVQDRDILIRFKAAYPNATRAEEQHDGTHIDTGEPVQSLPDDLPEGIRVEIISTNVEPDEVTPILRTFVDEIMDINPEYFADERIHPYSRCLNYEVYARIRREIADERIVNAEGLLERLALFSSRRRGQGSYEWDNEERVGHRNAVAWNPTSLEKLYGTHRVGKLLKCYLGKYVAESADQATDHPKLEVQWNKDLTEADYDSAVWRDEHAQLGELSLDDLHQELEVFLANALKWAGLTLRPDPDVYVADEYWSLEPREDPQPIEDRLVGDPTDALEEYHEQLAAARIAEESPTDAETDVLRVVTDGGVVDVAAAADRAGVSERTVYRTVETFTDLLELMDGEVSATDEVIRTRIREVLQGVNRRISELNQQVRRLVRGDETVDEDDQLMQWARRYEISVQGAHDDLTIRFGRGRFDERELGEILREGARAARDVGWRTFMAFARASIEAAGWNAEYALRQMGVAAWRTGIASVPVDVDGSLHSSGRPSGIQKRSELSGRRGGEPPG